MPSAQEPIFQVKSSYVEHAEISAVWAAEVKQIAAYLASCVSRIQSMATRKLPPSQQATNDQLVQKIVDVLLNREFNYQSRSKVSHLLPRLREAISKHVSLDRPLQIFFDYGGGYHASTEPDRAGPLNFQATVSELLMIHQVARLKGRLEEVYPPGFQFYVVIDNAVANYVNDVPVDKTVGFCRRLEGMISDLGMDDCISVVVQTECSKFLESAQDLKPQPVSFLSIEDRHNVERFLGHQCSENGARLHVGKYIVAENLWESELRSLIAKKNGIRFLQRASDEYLSFRPFHGGAVRVQCGEVGFRRQGEKIVPALITSNTHKSNLVVDISVNLVKLIGSRVSLKNTYEASLISLAA